MDYEDDEPDKQFEEFIKATRGQPKTPRNPKGAGRPSRTAEEYREFLAWKEAKEAGILQPLGELIGRVAGRGETSDGRSAQTVGRGLVRRVLSLIFKEKEIEKMKFDKVDEAISTIYQETKEYVLPAILIPALKPAAYLLGFWGWWEAENRLTKKIVFKTDQEYIEYAEKTNPNLIKNIRKVHIGDKEFYQVTVLRLPQILHLFLEAFEVIKTWIQNLIDYYS